jgi:hypothetical protein
MRRFDITVLSISLLLLSASAKAQTSNSLVNITLTVPQTNQIYVADLDMQHIQSSGVLFSATIQSLASSPIQVKLRMTVNVTLTDGTSYPDIADATTNPFTLQPGQVRVITNVDLSGSNPAISVESSHFNSDQVDKLKSVALATGKAPAGVYQFVLQCLDQNSMPVSEEAQGSIIVTNPSRIELALPMDQGNVSTLFPHFQWMANVDTVVLSVYEKLPSQVSPEDVVSGVPYLRVTVPNSTSPAPGSFNYPPSGPGVRPLQNGRTYYWYVQVPGSVSRGSGLRSDIWSFTIGSMGSAAQSGTQGGNINSEATAALKSFLSGTPYSYLASRISMLTGQATYDGNEISTDELIDILKNMDRSKVTSVIVH